MCERARTHTRAARGTAAPPGKRRSRGETVAIAGLMESARSDAAAGRRGTGRWYARAALRIEPRNPRLWHELAKVRLRAGRRAQAANLAARSNSFAGSDSALRAANQSIIEQASDREIKVTPCREITTVLVPRTPGAEGE